MDRNRRLAEIMGMCWHTVNQAKAGAACPVCHEWPITAIRYDFTTPEWRARLMDFATGQEWWPVFVADVQHPWWKANMNNYQIGDVKKIGEFHAYLWRNLPALVDEYMEGKK